MITVNLRGRLGNQLFQYALGRHLAIRNRCPLRLDVRALLRPGDRLGLDATRALRAYAIEARLDHPWIDRPLRTIRLRRDEVIVRERDRRGLIGDVLSLGPGTRLVGFFQSEEYFKPAESVIRRDLRLRRPIRQRQAIAFAKEIEENESVSVHVRRRDYVGNATFVECGSDYFARAIEVMRRRLERPRFFVFSDDVEWCRSNVSTDGVTFVEVRDRNRSTIDLELMRRCRHAIISNSSYSWWGAWLIENESKMIVSPERWFRSESLNREFRDLMTPAHWLRIESA